MLRLYSGSTDLERAQGRQIQQIENQISTSKASIQDLQVEREELQGRAAQAERAGRQVDPDLLAELTVVDAETARLQRLISRKRQEIVETNNDFEKQLERQHPHLQLKLQGNRCRIVSLNLNWRQSLGQ